MARYTSKITDEDQAGRQTYSAGPRHTAGEACGLRVWERLPPSEPKRHCHMGERLLAIGDQQQC